MEYVVEIWIWLSTLDRSFAFLLALPFLIAVAGVISEVARRRIGRT